MNFSSGIGFAGAVISIQTRKGSRMPYAQMEQSRGWQTAIAPEFTDLRKAQRSIFIATANAVGQPDIQHRGGPAVFVNVLDEKTIAVVDFNSNRQFWFSALLSN